MIEDDVTPPINNDPMEKRNEFIDHPSYLTYFVLASAVTYESRTLQSDLKNSKLSTVWDEWLMLIFRNCLKYNKHEMISLATDVKSPQIFFMLHAVISTYHDYVTLMKLYVLLYKLSSTKQSIPQSIFHFCGTP